MGAVCFSEIAVTRLHGITSRKTVIFTEVKFVNDAKIQTLVYLFVPNQLYMFRTMFSPIIRST